MSGSKNCGTFTQWNTMQQKERRSFYPSWQHRWTWRALYGRGVKLIFTGGHVSLVVAFKGSNVILVLYKYNYPLSKSSGQPLGRNKVPGQIKQGGSPDSASRPCVCHLYAKWNKPGSERQIPYDLTYKWKLINKTNKQANRTRDIEINNKLTVTREEGRGG